MKVVERIRELREQYPRWGKEKLTVLLRKEEVEVSATRVGRVIRRLKARGALREPENVRLAKLAQRRRLIILPPMNIISSGSSPKKPICHERYDLIPRLPIENVIETKSLLI